MTLTVVSFLEHIDADVHTTLRRLSIIRRELGRGCERRTERRVMEGDVNEGRIEARTALVENVTQYQRSSTD